MTEARNGSDGRARVRAALHGLALGDGVGAPFEGRRHVSRDALDDLLADDRPLVWTDDTHMAITLAEVLADHAGSVDPEVLGDAFAAAFTAEPWRGYGSGPPQVFALARGGASYVDAAASLFGGSGSFGNGAAMRVAPVAMVAVDDLEVVATLAATQAKVTHSHPAAIDGAVLVATTIARLAHDGPDRHPADAIDAAVRHLRDGAVRRATSPLLAVGDDPTALVRLAAETGTGVAAPESVPAAIAAVLAGDGFEEVLTRAVLLGGDTDTIAAMAGAMAAAREGPSCLPNGLVRRLEAHDRIDRLASRLVAGPPRAPEGA